MADSRFLDESGLSYLWTHASSSSDAGGIKERLALKADSSELSNYITISAANASYQPKDSDLTSIAGLTGTSGLLKKTAANTWTLDTSNYSTTTGTVRSIKVTASAPLSATPAAAVTTSGTFTITHDTSGVTGGTYKSVTVDSYGHVTAGTNPTTLSGYGITDAYTSSTIDSKIAAVNSAIDSVADAIPTQVSELENDAGYITSYTDKKVRQNYSDSATLGNYPIIMGNTVTTASTSNVTDEVRYDPTVYITPQNGTLTATRFNGKGAVYVGTCATVAGTANKVVACSAYSNLTVGDIIGVTFSAVNTAAVADLTLNVNGTGAKPIKKMYHTSGAANLNATGELRSTGIYFFAYDGTNWVWINNNYNNTYYYTSAYCTTAAGTAAKVGSVSWFDITESHHFQIYFSNANTATSNVTLNVASTGAKPLYLNGAAISSSNYAFPKGAYLAFYDADAEVYHIRTDGVIPGPVGKYADSVTVGSNGVYAYSLMLEDADNPGTWNSITTSGGTGTSKAAYTGAVSLKTVLYNNSSSSYPMAGSTGAVYTSGVIDLRYSTNIDSSYTAAKGTPVYLVFDRPYTSPGLSQKYYLAPTWWQIGTPSAADSYFYLLIGTIVNNYYCALIQDKTTFAFQNNEFRSVDISDFVTANAIGNAGYLLYAGGSSMDLTNFSGASKTGAIKISLPSSAASSNHFIVFTATIYNHYSSNNTAIDYRIGGYWYGSSSYWSDNRCFAYSLSNGLQDNANLTVRFGYDGTCACVYIGEVDTTWNHRRTIVHDIYVPNNSNVQRYYTQGWNIEFTTTALTGTIRTITNPAYHNAEWLNGAVQIANGGTGATTLAGAKSALGITAIENQLSGLETLLASI